MELELESRKAKAGVGVGVGVFGFTFFLLLALLLLLLYSFLLFFFFSSSFFLYNFPRLLCLSRLTIHGFLTVGWGRKGNMEASGLRGWLDMEAGFMVDNDSYE